MTTGQEGGNNVVNAFLASLATALMAAGALILRKLNKTPRPEGAAADLDYARMKSELRIAMREDIRMEYEIQMTAVNMKFEKEMRPFMTAIDDLQRSLSNESRSLRGDMQDLRGEMGQISQQVARQGGVLRGLEQRINEQ